MKVLLPLLLLLNSTFTFAQSEVIQSLARELQSVSGRFDLISGESQKHFTLIPASSVPGSLVELALANMTKEKLKEEIFETVMENAMAILDDKETLIGYVVFPITSLAIPGGDTDYFVLYYTFFSTEPSPDKKIEAYFQVFKPFY